MGCHQRNGLHCPGRHENLPRLVNLLHLHVVVGESNILRLSHPARSGGSNPLKSLLHEGLQFVTAHASEDDVEGTLVLFEKGESRFHHVLRDNETVVEAGREAHRQLESENVLAGKVTLHLLPMLRSLFAHLVILPVVHIPSRLAEFEGSLYLVDSLRLHH